MNCKVLVTYCTAIGMILLFSACTGTPKRSVWYSPTAFTLEQVYKAAVLAGADNGFTVCNQDRSAGSISLKKELLDGDETVVRNMSVKITQFGNKIMVSTKVSGGNAGVVEGALGGSAHKEITRTFYARLFRELGIANPSHQNAIIEDAR